VFALENNLICVMPDYVANNKFLEFEDLAVVHYIVDRYYLTLISIN